MARHLHPLLRRLLVVVCLSAFSGPSLAADGVIEINWVNARDGGVTSSDTAGVPVTIDSAGSYRLTSDLSPNIGPVGVLIVDPENFTVIDVTADDVSIDLGGFSIVGPGISGTGDGVRSSGKNAVVRNGTIALVGQDGVSVGDNARVHNLVVEGAGRYGVSGGESNLVLDSSLRDNGSWGLRLDSFSGFGRNVITGNNGGDEKRQIKAVAQGIHELDPNQCGLAGTCISDDLIVFYSGTHLTGNLGGIAGADSVCATEAANAGLSGTFLAWISDGVDSPDTRFNQSTDRYSLPSGQNVAVGYTDLTDGSIRAPISEMADGGTGPGSLAWTDTTTSGLQAAGPNCGGWTSTTGSGRLGQVLRSDFGWTDPGLTISCSANAGGVYCFEQ